MVPRWKKMIPGRELGLARTVVSTLKGALALGDRDHPACRLFSSTQADSPKCGSGTSSAWMSSKHRRTGRLSCPCPCPIASAGSGPFHGAHSSSRSAPWSGFMLVLSSDWHCFHESCDNQFPMWLHSRPSCLEASDQQQQSGCTAGLGEACGKAEGSQLLLWEGGPGGSGKSVRGLCLIFFQFPPGIQTGCKT